MFSKLCLATLVVVLVHSANSASIKGRSKTNLNAVASPISNYKANQKAESYALQGATKGQRVEAAAPAQFSFANLQPFSLNQGGQQYFTAIPVQLDQAPQQYQQQYYQLQAYQPAEQVAVQAAQPARVAVQEVRQVQPITVQTVQPVAVQAVRQVQAKSVEAVYSPVITKRTQEIVDVPTETDYVTPQFVIVESSVQPVNIEFRSRSSPVTINQVHIPGEKGTVKTTRSEEEPDLVIHEVVKPVIQEVREIIQPFRKVTQQILPVQEEVHSVISRGQRKQVVENVQAAEPAKVQAVQVVPVQQQQIVPVQVEQVRQEAPVQILQAVPVQIEEARQEVRALQPARVRVEQVRQEAPAQVQVVQAVPVQIEQVRQEVQALQPAQIQVQEVKVEAAPSVQYEEQQQEQQVESAPVQVSVVPAFANTGTIVRAGLIGGTRIIPSNDFIFQQQEESAALLPSVNHRPNGVKN